jgi:SAM-dependent methyltransferase
LRRVFRKEPFGVQAHVLGRFLTCPFLRLLPHLPAGARLLDLGAGHGAFAQLAVEYRGVSAVTVEPDLRKMLPAPRHSAIRRVAGYSSTVSGEFDAVSILDVLYRVPLEGWDAILAGAFANLRPGGVLLLKEIDPENRLKGAWNRMQERLADLLGMTLGEAFSYETRSAMADRLSRLGFERIEAIPLGAGYPHAHILYLARRPER